MKPPGTVPLSREWVRVCVHARLVRLPEKALCLVIAADPVRGGYKVAAVESHEPGRGVRVVFDKHAHADLGWRRAIHNAQALANRYVVRWAAENCAALPPCACGPIQRSPGTATVPVPVTQKKSPPRRAVPSVRRGAGGRVSRRAPRARRSP